MAGTGLRAPARGARVRRSRSGVSGAGWLARWRARPRPVLGALVWRGGARSPDPAGAPAAQAARGRPAPRRRREAGVRPRFPLLALAGLAVLWMLVGGWAASVWVPAAGGLVPLQRATLVPVLRVPAVFFRPGIPVLAPVSGHLATVAPAGDQAAGAVLASVQVPAHRATTGSAGAGAGGQGRLRAWRGVLAALLCVRRTCGPAGGAAGGAGGGGRDGGAGTPVGGARAATLVQRLWRLTRPAGSTATRSASRSAAGRSPRAAGGPARAHGAGSSVVLARFVARAAVPGFFQPGWYALAALPASAYADLSPAVIALRRWPAPRPGTPVAAGTPIGVASNPWTGVWVAVLPELEADAALGAASSVAGTGGVSGAAIGVAGRAAVPVAAVAGGPPVGGQRAVILVSDRLGGGPAIPSFGQVRLRLPAVTGVAVPLAALRWRAAGARLVSRLRAAASPGGAAHCFVAVWIGGRARWVAVRVLGVAAGHAVVAGLPAAAAGVLTRPSWVLPWFGGHGSAPLRSRGRTRRQAAR